MKAVSRVFVLAVFIFLTGCAGKKFVDESGAGSSDGQVIKVEDEKAPAWEEAALDGEVKERWIRAGYASLGPDDELTLLAETEGRLYTVYFDFDRYTIEDGSIELLDKNARWLSLNKGVSVTLEGHADERGETEYNLGLGDKRAQTVRKYLADTGLSANRFFTVSYGEEKPADPGSNEAAWSRNRRVEFMIADVAAASE